MVATWYKALRCVIRYLAQNPPLSILGSYFFISVLLKSFTPIDITIPCLYTLFFGVKCIGCGMTTSFTHMAHFDFHQAYHANKLAFIVLPFIIIWVSYDIFSFWKENCRIKIA